jgi:hypothetical protein
MNHYNEVDYSLIACVLLGLLLLAVVLKTLSVTIAKSAIPAGYRSAVVNVLGLSFTLVEIPAQQRLDYLKRCMKLSASDGFEFMRDDLIVSTELIALHLRRWYMPRGVIAFRLRRLTAATIAELFRSCVTLSNLPFSIVKDDETAEPDNLIAAADPAGDPDDEWDWVDGENEKKKRPVALQ